MAFVGCKAGGIAGYHADCFQKAGCELVACCDLIAENGEGFAQRHGIGECFTDVEAMMEKVRPEIVVICTPHHVHAGNTVAVAAHRPRAILVEKPIALSLAEADDMIAACEQAGTLLIVGHQRRYNVQYARAKALLRTGVIGRPLRIEGHVHGSSALYVDGTHTIDLIRFYLDDAPVKWVMGQMDFRSERSAWGSYVEDASLALFTFADQTRAMLTTGGHFLYGGEHPAVPGMGTAFATSAEFYYHQVVIVGENGTIEVNGDPHSQAKFPILRVIGSQGVEEYSYERLIAENGGSRWYNGLSPQQELVDCLADGHRHPLNAASARATLEIILAIMESSRRRSLIELPLEVSDVPLFDLIAKRKAGDLA